MCGLQATWAAGKSLIIHDQHSRNNPSIHKAFSHTIVPCSHQHHFDVVKRLEYSLTFDQIFVSDQPTVIFFGCYTIYLLLQELPLQHNDKNLVAFNCSSIGIIGHFNILVASLWSLCGYF